MKKLRSVLLIVASFSFIALCYAGNTVQQIPEGWTFEYVNEQPGESRLDKLIEMKVIPIDPPQVNDWKTEANTKFTPYVGAGTTGPVVPEQIVRPVAPVAPVVPPTPKLP